MTKKITAEGGTQLPYEMVKAAILGQPAAKHAARLEHAAKVHSLLAAAGERGLSADRLALGTEIVRAGTEVAKARQRIEAQFGPLSNAQRALAAASIYSQRKQGRR